MKQVCEEPKVTIRCSKEMFEPKQLAQSEIVQDLPKKGNQELVRKITRN